VGSFPFLPADGIRKYSRLALTLGADSVQVKPLAYNLITGSASDLDGHIAHKVDLRINDLATVDAEKVEVRVRLVAVVPILDSAEFEFKYLAHLFEQRQCLVNCRQGRGRKVLVHLLVNSRGAGVARTRGDNPEQRDALRGSAIAAFFELSDQLLEAGMRIHKRLLSESYTLWRIISQTHGTPKWAYVNWLFRS
jgi:hypothetical protein